ncbi:MAG TPA: hypothetical protein PKL04_00455 [Methanofastidiosum sp.]|jgi:hypothetical protein|nr:hypothetical protein [Methanofastidiosum sp.]
MKTYKDPSKSKESKWFQMNPLLTPNNLVGIDREDGKTTVTLFPGDIIELSPMEIYANQDRSCFRDGMIVEISGEKVKDALKRKYEAKVTNDIDEWMQYDDVEFINKAKDVKSRSVLRTLLAKAKEKDRSYKTIQALEKMIAEVAGV